VPIGLALYASAVLSMGGSFWVKDPLGKRSQAFLGVVLFLTLTSSITYEISVANPGYGTDAIAFAHVGAEVLLQGQNPYEIVDEPLASVIDRFGIPATFVTRTTSGEPIDRLISYPGGHVLAYTGGMAIGIKDMRWVTLAFELAALGLIWWALVPQARSLLVLVLLIEPNLTVLFTSGGVTDWLWVLPILVSAVLLHRQWFGWAGLAVGLACAIKQQPWFAVPFIAIWVYVVASQSSKVRARDALTGLSAGILAGFVIPNVPFIVWSPGDWVQGVLAPALSNLVPDGQGLSILASRGILPLSQGTFAILTASAFVLAVLIYYRWFDRTQDLLWVLPPAILLLSNRSFHNYFVYWIPPAVLWLCMRYGQTDLHITPRSTDPPSERGRGSVRGVVGMLALLAVPTALIATTVGGATLGVGSVRPNVTSGVLTFLDVELTNLSDQPIIPVFDLFWGGWPVPWTADGKPIVLPGETRVVRVKPESPEVIPPLQVTPDGELKFVEFRVRVNASGNSVFQSSDLISVPSFESGIVNPEFEFWGRLNHASAPAPFGWNAVSRQATDSSLRMQPVGSGQGVVLRVSNAGPALEGWAESALTQDVAKLGSCYQVNLRHSSMSVTNSMRDSVGSVGVQLIQTDASLWFVPSLVETPRVTDLPGKTRVVEIPSTLDDWNDLTFDVARYGEAAGIRVGDRATVKLFNALHESQPGPQEIQIRQMAECESQSG
jgi:hypothetical protein